MVILFKLWQILILFKCPGGVQWHYLCYKLDENSYFIQFDLLYFGIVIIYNKQILKYYIYIWLIFSLYRENQTKSVFYLLSILLLTNIFISSNNILFYTYVHHIMNFSNDHKNINFSLSFILTRQLYLFIFINSLFNVFAYIRGYMYITLSRCLC